MRWRWCRGQPVGRMGRRSRPDTDKRPLEEKNRCERVNEHPGGGGGRGDVNRAQVFRPVHEYARHSRRLDELRHRSAALTRSPPPSPPGRFPPQGGRGSRPRRLPCFPSRHKRDIPSGDEPADLSGRDRGNQTASGLVRDDSSRTRRHDPLGWWPRESQYVLGAAADRSASRHRGAIAKCRPQEKLVPASRTPRLC